MVTNSFYKRYGKRCLDLAITIPALIILSPVLIITALLVRVWLGSPILFRQDRPGLNGHIFFISKFRTMTDGHDIHGNLLPDESRLTAFGKLLRSSSLDELPELWNVLKGEMSLVGPRPLRTMYLPRYSAHQNRRHEVMPGITGWAQVNGRNAISWEKRFDLDVWYVEKCNLWLDVKILLLTIAAVFSRDGIAAEGHSTMPSFNGSAPPSEGGNLSIG